MKKTAFLLLVFAIQFSASAKYNKHNSDSGSGSGIQEIAAGCSPATAATDLDINNVKALIQTGGDMWWDLQAAAKYEIPKGSGRTAIFSGSLWLGGQDVSGQLKVAAQRFRTNGNDYWPGPLQLHNAEIEPERCRDFDRHFVTYRDQVTEFVAWFNCKEDPNCVESDEFPDYSIPDTILNWPAHGDVERGEDFYLAPFIDVNGDGIYNPAADGDYPGYDLKGENDCSKKIANIYGDMNLWWVFNDKGNIHSETGSNSIGMEIRAQAFGFATNDEVNNMTFYNYELINRSTFTLTETYFGQWVDADLGGYNDDYVGCDVMRGLGYCYNGDELDENVGGAIGYGSQPPAIGVDFFQGPFQDTDGIDNAEGIGPNEALNGVGYGDGEPDNERFGMRRFLYHGITGSIAGPQTGTQYYNFLRGRWNDGNKMCYGGNGYSSNCSVFADFMFPGDSDPLGWGNSDINGNNGIVMPPWTEETAGNPPGDRRFLQSAGPFTLTPGALNNITVGVVYARAESGGPFASVLALKQADAKTQAMFDHCFQIQEPPKAPDLTIKEMDQELILYLSNPSNSNNYNEEYAAEDPFLVAPDSVDTDNDGINDVALTLKEQSEYKTYKFQGYKIYQVKDKTVGPNDLGDPDKARLVAQVDVKDGVGQIVNHYFDKELNGNIAVEEVNGADQGIRHSFRVVEDQFAQGSKNLVNHKTYYYMAIAYAFNNHGGDYGNLSYLTDLYDPNDPEKLDGQKLPYIGSRKAAAGGIKSVPAIPHKNAPENNGTYLNSKYGDEVELNRIEGKGNGGNFIKFKKESLEEAVKEKPWRVLHPTYEKGNGPLQVKVIDPLNVVGENFAIQFRDSLTNGNLDDAHWRMFIKNNSNPSAEDTVYSTQTIAVENEQLILDWGLSVTIKQVKKPGVEGVANNGFVGATIEFDDVSRPWLTGIPDIDGTSVQNWIRSGTNEDPDAPDNKDYLGVDDQQVYEAVLGGTWAPFCITAQDTHCPMPDINQLYQRLPNGYQRLQYLESVDIVFTSDKSKWTRAAVVEMQDDPASAEGGAEKGRLRATLSVDKNGEPFDTTGLDIPADSLMEKLTEDDSYISSDPDDPNFISPVGMGWFPGYAVSIETGERLNIAFGEDSWMKGENGHDMLWNPTKNISTEPHIEGVLENWRLGGKHFVYVFRNNIAEEGDTIGKLPLNTSTSEFLFHYPENRMPSYDAGKYIYEQLIKNIDTSLRNVYRACMWTGFPLLAEKQELLSTDATISIRVNQPFDHYATGDFISDGESLTEGEVYYVDKGPVIHDSTMYVRNNWFKAVNDSFGVSTDSLDDWKDVLSTTINAAMPMYEFSTHHLAPVIDSLSLAQEALDLIYVVPNPYYAYSQYEESKLDNRVKVINLPETCTVTIYTVNGILIRKFDKDDPTITSIDWDLKNHARIPISSGVYIIHVDVPGVGEKILKWFGALRPVDLDAF